MLYSPLVGVIRYFNYCLLLLSALVLLPANAYAALDYGDAPDKYGFATHTIAGGVSLGNTVTADSGSLGSTTATTDTDDGLFTNATLTTPVNDNSLPLNSTTTFYAKVKGTGKLYVWADWDNDGVFGSASDELVVNGLNGTNQTLSFNVTVPASSKYGMNYMRLRFSSDTAAANPTGTANNGEVEDYRFAVDLPSSGTANPPAASCTGTWTTSGTSYTSTTNQGLQVTLTHTAPTGANWTIGANSGNEALNVNGAFMSPLLNGVTSFNNTFFWDTTPEVKTASTNDGKTGTLQITFNKTVRNPILHLDRLGGTADAISPATNLSSNTAILKPNAANPSLTFTRLAGVDHFTVTNTQVSRAIETIQSLAGAEAGTDRTNSTSMGSVQLNGMYSSITLDVGPSAGPDGTGADGFEIVVCSNSDFGDAPGYMEASHQLTNNVYLGQTPDGELTSKTSATANGDLYDDGVLVNGTTSLQNASFTRGVPRTLSIPVVGTGKVYAWFDWDGDGTFGNNTNELVINGVTGTTQTLNLTVTPPASAKPGTTYARFRITSDTAATTLSPAGFTTSGEVEDYQVMIAAPVTHNCPAATSPDGLATSGTGTYKANLYWLNWSCGATTQFNVGDTVNKSFALGNGLALNAQLTNITEALEPYTVGTNSNDTLQQLYGGINPIGLSNAVVQGTNSPDPKFDLSVSATYNGAPISLNMVVADAEDTSGANEAVIATTNGNAFETLETKNTLSAAFSNSAKTLTLSDTASTGTGTLIAMSDLASTLSMELKTAAKQAAAFGVVLGYDYGDAPSSYGSLKGHILPLTASGGAKPTTVTAASALTLGTLSSRSSYYLGSVRPDSDLATQTSDDTTGIDDEDGVTLPAVLRANKPATITANVVGSVGYLQGWIDWNRDGDFADSGEQIATNVADGSSSDSNTSAGVIGISLTAPIGLNPGASYARFRWSSEGEVGTNVVVYDGEVEDYPVTLTTNSAPIITSNGGGTTASIAIAENQTAVTTVTATDADNDTLTYSITGGADAAKFTLNSTTGVLSFVTAPDYENPTDIGANNGYEVQVTVSDGNGGTDLQSITVNVTDVVENLPPVITSNGGGTTASITQPENQAAITTVTATDPNNDVVTFSIAGGLDAAKFSINSTTGVLTFLTAPDYENPTDAGANNSYEVTVQASDGKGGVDTQALSVIITDVNEAITLKLKALLQGAYTGSGLMADDLRVANLIPTSQPYTQAPFNYAGTETVSSTLLARTGTTAIVDWVLVELRGAVTPSSVLARQAALVQRDGTIINTTGSTTLVFPTLTAGSYYVMVKHRNHLAIMTQQALSLQVAPTLVDFTTTDTATYGLYGRMSSGTTALMWAGAANLDQAIIANGPNSDSTTIMGAVMTNPNNQLANSNYRLEGYRHTDIDMDGHTVYAGPENDLNIIIGNILLHPANGVHAANYIIDGINP